MTKVLVPLLALVTVGAVVFVLVELHASTAPRASSDVDVHPPGASARPPFAPPPPPPTTAPPRTAPPPSAAPPPTAASPPTAEATEPPPPAEPPTADPVAAPPSDPLDVVVHGKTRREWHAYYAERQQEIAADIARYQEVVDRAVAGEEPDPKELGEAHDHIRELNERLKEDLEALQQIDASP